MELNSTQLVEQPIGLHRGEPIYEFMHCFDLPHEMMHPEASAQMCV